MYLASPKSQTLTCHCLFTRRFNDFMSLMNQYQIFITCEIWEAQMYVVFSSQLPFQKQILELFPILFQFVHYLEHHRDFLYCNTLCSQYSPIFKLTSITMHILGSKPIYVTIIYQIKDLTCPMKINNWRRSYDTHDMEFFFEIFHCFCVHNFQYFDGNFSSLI